MKKGKKIDEVPNLCKMAEEAENNPIFMAHMQSVVRLGSVSRVTLMHMERDSKHSENQHYKSCMCW